MQAHTFTHPALAALNPLAYERLLESEAAADQNELRHRQLCDVDSLSQALYDHCFGKRAYDGHFDASKHFYDERALRLDYAAAGAMPTPDLLALALGLASDPKARIAAMDELARRLGVVEAV